METTSPAFLVVFRDDGRINHVFTRIGSYCPYQIQFIFGIESYTKDNFLLSDETCILYLKEKDVPALDHGVLVVDGETARMVTKTCFLFFFDDDEETTFHYSGVFRFHHKSPTTNSATYKAVKTSCWCYRDSISYSCCTNQATPKLCTAMVPCCPDFSRPNRCGLFALIKRNCSCGVTAIDLITWVLVFMVGLAVYSKVCAREQCIPERELEWRIDLRSNGDLVSGGFIHGKDCANANTNGILLQISHE